jgi:hypothetical protein
LLFAGKKYEKEEKKGGKCGRKRKKWNDKGKTELQRTKKSKKAKIKAKRMHYV